MGVGGSGMHAAAGDQIFVITELSGYLEEGVLHFPLLQCLLHLPQVSLLLQVLLFYETGLQLPIFLQTHDLPLQMLHLAPPRAHLYVRLLFCHTTTLLQKQQQQGNVEMCYILNIYIYIFKNKTEEGSRSNAVIFVAAFVVIELTLKCSFGWLTGVYHVCFAFCLFPPSEPDSS